MNEPPVRARKHIVVQPSDATRIVAGLERWAEDDDFVALRTRAFVYLLWDGALRTKAAVWLNAEEVVEDPRASRIRIVEKIAQRSCEGNNFRAHTFLISDRTRGALADYLKVVRSGGWLAKSDRLTGPLWISSHHHGTQQRMSQRTAMQRATRTRSRSTATSRPSGPGSTASTCTATSRATFARCFRRSTSSRRAGRLSRGAERSRRPSYGPWCGGARRALP